MTKTIIETDFGTFNILIFWNRNHEIDFESKQDLDSKPCNRNHIRIRIQHCSVLNPACLHPLPPNLNGTGQGGSSLKLSIAIPCQTRGICGRDPLI